MRYYLSLCAASLLLLASCKQKEETDFLAANIDSTVKPGDDFFLYANGGWIKKTPIPAAESGWGIGNLVNEEIYNRKKKINENAVTEKAADGSVTQKIGDFWFSGMDTTNIDRQGLQPLSDQFQSINKAQTADDIVSLTADLHAESVNALFGDYVAQDDKNSEVMAYQLSQGGLGMPNRDYYFKTDSRTVSVQNAYKTYLGKIFSRLPGADTSAAAVAHKVSAVYGLETRLATSSRTLADLRDPYKNYNKMTLAALQQTCPAFNWNSYFSKLGMHAPDTVIVGQPEFLSALSTQLKSTAIQDWKDYLTAHLVMSSAGFLDNTTFMDNFQYRQALSGAKEPRIRWKRVLDAEEGEIGEALGQLFVKEYFSEKARQRYSDLVEAIRTAYKERIEKLSWMSAETKQRALAKLSAITKKVGYPDKWKDFSAMKIDRGPFVLNIERANKWWHQYRFSKLGKPVDRTEWDMTPQTYNAYYNPSNNEIVLPAGMFAVPGKRDEDLDDAFVYGYAAASTIGHEITHGFDDQGRQYDSKGNLKGWWQPADSIQFTDRAGRIIRQFTEFNPVDTLHINGSATQGENIADLGGLLLGLDAFKKTDTYKKGEKIDGFTPLQRYFLGYAYSWMIQERKERLANQVMTDVHAPAKERVNGPLANIPEFYEAFNIKPGDKMYRPDSLRVSIW